MGMTCVSLHVRGVDPETLRAMLPPTDLLRENNFPWLAILPPDADGSDDIFRLEKLAKRLTKVHENAAALLFFYFDDDLFALTLYKNGKRAADCRNDSSWAKLGKQMNQLLGDDAPGKAFRYASRCVDLAEKLKLLEESVGTALLDYQEAEARTVPRSDDTLRRIKARESALRKRKNQLALTELPPEDWPPAWQSQLALYRFLVPYWRDCRGDYLLFRFGDSYFSVPWHPELAVQRYDDETHRDHLIVLDRDSGQVYEVKIPESEPGRVLWITKQGEFVCLFMDILKEETEPGRWFRQNGNDHAVCLRRDGCARWSFAPPTWQERLDHVYTSPDGAITLCVRARWRDSKWSGGELYQIEGETGELLRSRTIPSEDHLQKLLRVDALDGFLYIADRKEIVLLDNALQETARWSGFKGSEYLDEINVVGSRLWCQDLESRKLRLHDLRSGSLTEITPEIPTCIMAVLPDGRVLGTNEKRTRLLVFDASGRVISQHSAAGSFDRVCMEPDRVCILETRAPETYGFVSEELFEAASLHLWRIDQV